MLSLLPEARGCLFKEIVACRLKSLARVAPSHCGELVGLAEMPKRGVIAIAVLPAHFQHVGKVGAAGKNREARRLSGIVKADPCHAANSVRKPVATLYDCGVRTPWDTYCANVVHQRITHGLIHRNLIGLHPGVGHRADHTVGHLWPVALFLSLFFTIMRPLRFIGVPS